MPFEWDKKKNLSNARKHGIDFATAALLWQDVNRVEIESPYPVEDRTVVIGKIDKKLWAAVVTQRGDSIRIISARRARKKEAQLYDQEKTS
jgi:uncharacterized DUF497 family protein